MQNQQMQEEQIESQQTIHFPTTHQEMFEKGVELTFGMGKKEKINKIKAFEYFQQSHQNGNPFAAVFMAYLLWEGNEGIKYDIKEAERLCSQAAKSNTIFEMSTKGDSMAQFSLGFMHYHGLGVERDYNKSFSLFLESAKQGNSISQFYVGYSYLNGYGVGQNLKEVIKWWKLSAEQGNAEAQYWMGLSHRRGWGVKKDIEESVKWLTLSAEQNHSWTQYRLGEIYSNEEGEKVKKNISKSIQWFKLSAENHNSGAQEALGEIFRDENKVKNEKESIKWFKIFAKNGNDIRRQYDFGLGYLTGRNKFKKNEIECLNFFYLCLE